MAKRKIKKQYEMFQNTTRNISYKYLCYLLVMDLFNWKLPPELRKEFIEWQLLKFGYVAIWKDGEKYYCGFATPNDFDEYNMPLLGSTIECQTRKGAQFTKVYGEECIIIWNNDIRVPDIWLNFYADMFAETDISQYTLIEKARLSPIPVVTTGAMKETVKTIIEKVGAGETDVVVDDDMLKRIEAGDVSKAIDTVSVTEPEQIERMQYLSKYHDDLLRRLCTMYGLPLQSTGKMAQVNEKELEGYDCFSLVVPDQMMRARKDGIEFGRKVFGESFPIDIDYGEPWKVQNSRTKEDATEEVEGTGEEGGEDDE